MSTRTKILAGVSIAVVGATIASAVADHKAGDCDCPAIEAAEDAVDAAAEAVTDIAE